MSEIALSLNKTDRTRLGNGLAWHRADQKRAFENDYRWKYRTDRSVFNDLKTGLALQQSLHDIQISPLKMKYLQLINP